MSREGRLRAVHGTDAGTRATRARAPQRTIVDSPRLPCGQQPARSCRSDLPGQSLGLQGGDLTTVRSDRVVPPALIDRYPSVNFLNQPVIKDSGEEAIEGSRTER